MSPISWAVLQSKIRQKEYEKLTEPNPVENTHSCLNHRSSGRQEMPYFCSGEKRGTVQMGKTQLQQLVSGNNRFILGWKALWGVSAILRLELTLSLQQPQDSTPVWKCSWCSHMGFSCWQRNSLICYRNLHSPPSVTSVYCKESYSSRET